jgi:Tol biopolymer transport system component
MPSPSLQHPTVQSFRSMLPRLLVLAVALTVAACVGDESPLAPAEEPVPSDAVAPTDAVAALTAPRIVFTSYANMRGDLYLTDAQGSTRTPLTTWANTEFAPSWSYDHKHVAMVRFRTDATNTQHYDIYLMDADGTHKRWAKSYTSSFHIMNPSWSPDGSRLVVTVILQNLPYVATLDLATGQLALVWYLGGNYVQGEDPSYDPTGQKIIYVGTSHNTVDLVVPGGPHTVPVSSDTRVGNPTFSPDGKRIAYSRIVTGTSNTEVYVKTLATGVVTRLTNSGKHDGEPSWSPDGSRIAFASDRSGRPQIWTMSSSTGGSLVRITNSSRDDVEPAWWH